MEIGFYRDDEGRGGVNAWRAGASCGQPDIDGYYEPGSGDTAGICGATPEEANEIARHCDDRRPVGEITGRQAIRQYLDVGT